MNADAADGGPLLVPLLPLIAWLLPMGGRAFARAVGTSALRRAGRHRLLRNAIAALGNVRGRCPSAPEAQQRAGCVAGRADGPACALEVRRGGRPTVACTTTRRAASAHGYLALDSDHAPRRALPGHPLRPRALRRRRAARPRSPRRRRGGAARAAGRPDRSRLSAVRRHHRRAARRRSSARHERNAVRLEWSAEPDPHAAASATLDAWLADGTLERRAAPAAFYYRHGTGGHAGRPDGGGHRGPRAARAMGRRRPAATSTRCPGRRPIGWACCARPGRSSARSCRSTSIARSGTTTS